MGRPMDTERYERVKGVCGLVEDLKTLPGGVSPAGVHTSCCIWLL